MPRYNITRFDEQCLCIDNKFRIRFQYGPERVWSENVLAIKNPLIGIMNNFPHKHINSINSNDEFTKVIFKILMSDDLCAL